MRLTVVELLGMISFYRQFYAITIIEILALVQGLMLILGKLLPELRILDPGKLTDPTLSHRLLINKTPAKKQLCRRLRWKGTYVMQ
jgi:hypothetical protein